MLPKNSAHGPTQPKQRGCPVQTSVRLGRYSFNLPSIQSASSRILRSRIYIHVVVAGVRTALQPHISWRVQARLPGCAKQPLLLRLQNPPVARLLLLQIIRPRRILDDQPSLQHRVRPTPLPFSLEITPPHYLLISDLAIGRRPPPWVLALRREQSWIRQRAQLPLGARARRRR